MAFSDEILEAVADNRALRVAYWGGSQPGTARTITPLEIDGDKVWARCHVTGQAKLFVLAKLGPAENGLPEFSREPPPPRFQKVSEIAAFYTDTLEGMGWVADLSGEELTLTRRYKNGKPLKHPSVTLAYEPIVSSSHLDENLEEVYEKHEAKNKFFVSGAGYYSRFKTADKAARKFMELAQAAKH